MDFVTDELVFVVEEHLGSEVVIVNIDQLTRLFELVYLEVLVWDVNGNDLVKVVSFLVVLALIWVMASWVLHNNKRLSSTLVW